MNCPACEQPMPDPAAFCPHCGEAVYAPFTGETRRLTALSSLRRGRCPHCGSAEVFTDRELDADSASQIVVARGLLPNTATLSHYVCRGCGYTESYILSARERDEIARRWAQVPRRG